MSSYRVVTSANGFDWEFTEFSCISSVQAFVGETLRVRPGMKIHIMKMV